MAKVKDRLIFETKKIDAVTQRKASKEQKLRAREAQANKAAEKVKRKRNHFEAMQEWQKTGNHGGDLLDRLERGNNKKRLAANKKYGFGGKRGRFKQNDPKRLNDMSDYNPRGNFPGGTVASAGRKQHRKGKRARDAARSKAR